MKNEEILKKAIEVAVKNGYDEKFLEKNWLVGATFGLAKNNKEGWRDLVLMKEVIIFSHSFAQKFWGEEIPDVRCSNCREHGYDACTVCEDRVSIPEWQYYLQQLVLEPKPLKYIEKFL